MNFKRKFCIFELRRMICCFISFCSLLFLSPCNLFSQTIDQKLSFETVNDCSWDWKHSVVRTHFSLDSLVLCDNLPSLKITLDKRYPPGKISNIKNKKNFYQENISGKMFLLEEDSLRILNEMNSLRFILGKNIILPSYKKGDQCKLSIKSMTKNVRNLKLQIARIDGDENFIGIDSIYIENETGQWKEYALMFKLSKEKALEIGISYEGTGDSCQQINLGNPAIYIDNKNIGYLNINSNQYFGNKEASLEPKHIVVLSDSTDHRLLSGIEGVEDKLIIGLGECMHGSTSILQAMYQFTRNAISDHNCKLVLLEYPIDMSLALELYVLGLVDESYGEEIKKDLRGSFGDYPVTFEFVRWLRDYNSRTKEKVHLLGIDNPQASKILLGDFIYQLLNKQRIHPYFRLINSGNLEELAEQFVLNDTIRGKIDEQSLRLFPEIIKTCLYSSEYSKDDLSLRDYKMYLRLSFLRAVLLREKQKTVVLAHSQHLSKMQNVYFRLFEQNKNHLGNYLSKEFSEKYCVISFQVGQGTYAQDSCIMFWNNIICKLPEAVNGSFEKSALNTNLDYFLYPSSKLNEHILSQRIVTRGSRGRNQFKLNSLKKQFDAYVFIRENIPSRNIEQFPSFYVDKRLEERDRRYYSF